MKIGDKVHVTSMGTHCFVSEIIGETNTSWRVLTAKGPTNYLKRTLQKRGASSKGFYIEEIYYNRLDKRNYL